MFEDKNKNAFYVKDAKIGTYIVLLAQFILI